MLGSTYSRVSAFVFPSFGISSDIDEVSVRPWSDEKVFIYSAPLRRHVFAENISV